MNSLFLVGGLVALTHKESVDTFGGSTSCRFQGSDGDWYMKTTGSDGSITVSRISNPFDYLTEVCS